MRIGDWSSDVCSSDLLARNRPQHEEAAGGIIGDRIPDANVPIGHPAVDDLDRWHDIFHRADHFSGRQVRMGQVPADDDSELKIGRASGRERGWQDAVVWGVWGICKKTK